MVPPLRREQEARVDEIEREHNLELALEHREAAARERQLAWVAHSLGNPNQARRHVLNADLHDGRAIAYEAKVWCAAVRPE